MKTLDSTLTANGASSLQHAGSPTPFKSEARYAEGVERGAGVGGVFQRFFRAASILCRRASRSPALSVFFTPLPILPSACAALFIGLHGLNLIERDFRVPSLERLLGLGLVEGPNPDVVESAGALAANVKELLRGGGLLIDGFHGRKKLGVDHRDFVLHAVRDLDHVEVFVAAQELRSLFGLADVARRAVVEFTILEGERERLAFVVFCDVGFHNGATVKRFTESCNKKVMPEVRLFVSRSNSPEATNEDFFGPLGGGGRGVSLTVATERKSGNAVAQRTGTE